MRFLAIHLSPPDISAAMLFESKIQHAELKQSRKQHNRPTLLPLLRFFSFPRRRWPPREEDKDKKMRGEQGRGGGRIKRISGAIRLAQMYAHRGLRGGWYRVGCTLPTEYMHELEHDSLEKVRIPIRRANNGSCLPLTPGEEVGVSR